MGGAICTAVKDLKVSRHEDRIQLALAFQDEALRPGPRPFIKWTYAALTRDQAIGLLLALIEALGIETTSPAA